jgi:hypothetical protein
MLLDCEEIVQEWRNWKKVNDEYDGRAGLIATLWRPAETGRPRRSWLQSWMRVGFALQSRNPTHIPLGSPSPVIGAATTWPLIWHPVPLENGARCVFTVVIPAENNHLAPFSSGTGCQINGQVVAAPITGPSQQASTMWQSDLLDRQDSQPPGAVQKSYAHPAWIVIPAENNHLAPFSSGTGCQINGQVVAAPITGEGLLRGRPVSAGLHNVAIRPARPSGLPAPWCSPEMGFASQLRY